MASIGTMVKQLAGLLGTKDVSAWEAGFIENMVKFTNDGEDTTKLTTRQVEVIEKTHERHFA